MGPELSRSFRALKVWFTLKEHGTIKLGQKISDNCEQAQYLVSLLEKHEQIIRIIRPVSLNIVNFRFEPLELDNELIDMFNSELVKDIEKCGIVLPSSTRIQNRIYIRVCIVSHRTIYQDFHLFMDILFDLYRIRIQTFI
jgi:glutamate/tyrosine decarboxylase-like PLP-dependent enzyme